MSRRFSTLLLVLCLLAAVAATAGCSGEDTIAAADSPAAAWQMMPDDVAMVMHVDFAALRESPLYPSMSEDLDRKLVAPGTGYLEFVEQTGFDYRRDLETVTVAAAGVPDDAASPVYVVVRGKFDRPRMEAYLRSNADVRQGTVAGLATYSGTFENDARDHPATLAWLDDRTLLVSQVDAFPDLAAAVRGGGAGAANAALRQLLTGSAAQLFAAFDVQRVAGAGDDGTTSAGAAGPLANPMVAPLRGLETVVLEMDTSDGLALALRARAGTADEARAVHQLVSGYIGMGRMFTAENPELGRMLDRLQLVQTDATVSLDLRLTAEEVVSAIDSAKRPAVALGG